MKNKIYKLFKKFFPIFSILLLATLFLLFIFRVYRSKPYFVTSVITTDIEVIANSLNSIDATCSILSFENRRNYVDFLNVIKFEGSEVGCLNLAYPDNWEGPYVKDNPTMQGKLYEILKTKEGNFVVPGKGVKPPNGLTIGKDFEINYESSIQEMLREGGPLNYKGLKLAIRLDFDVGDWVRQDLRKGRLESFNKTLEEFNQAMPFTENKQDESNKVC